MILLVFLFAGAQARLAAPDDAPLPTDNNYYDTLLASELTQSTNLARVEHLQRQCDALDEPSSTTLADARAEALEHVLVDHDHKLLYCYVPKVACTNWKRVMMLLAGKWTNGTDVLAIPAPLAHSAGMFPTLGSVPPADRERIADEYNKLIFARHPFERLLSAYRNKLESESPSASYFQKRVGRLILKLLRPHAPSSVQEAGKGVTFEEFIEFLTLPVENTNDTQYALNEHWESIYRLCHPCLIKYSIIGKYETLLDDSILALNMINASYISFPRDIRTSGTAKKLQTYYGSIPLDIIKKVYDIYLEDFKLFDYNLEEILGFDLA